MPQRSERALEKVTIRLFAGDKDRLNEYFPQVGHNAAIRQIVAKHLRAMDERMSQQKPAQEQAHD